MEFQASFLSVYRLYQNGKDFSVCLCHFEVVMMIIMMEIDWRLKNVRNHKLYSLKDVMLSTSNDCYRISTSMMCSTKFHRILAPQEILDLENRLMIREGCLPKTKGLKSKRLLGLLATYLYPKSLVDGVGETVMSLTFPNEMVYLDWIPCWIPGFKQSGLTQTWLKVILGRIPHSYELPYSSTVLFKPPLFVATLSVTEFS